METALETYRAFDVIDDLEERARVVHLDERMREFYGEGFRWFDLARTQTWAERAGKYTISGDAWGNHTPKTYTRTIENYRYLFPIPQGQLNGMEMTKEERAAYQNPNYPTE